MTGGQLLQFLTYAVLLVPSAAALTEMWGEISAPPVQWSGCRSCWWRRQRSPLRLNRQFCRSACSAGSVLTGSPSLSVAPESAALDEFSLDVAPGETIAFVGPSGAGKSTTFQMLLAILRSGRRLQCSLMSGGWRTLTRSHCARRSGSCRRNRALWRERAREHTLRTPRCQRCGDRSGGEGSGGR